MPALWIGTLCLIGLLFIVVGRRHRRHAFAHVSGCAGPAWGYVDGTPLRHGHHRGGPFFRHSPLFALLAELDTTPGQEKVVRDAVGTWISSARETMKETHGTREALAEIVVAPELDKARLQSWLDGHGERLRALGADASLAIARIHEVLDDEQRKRLGRQIAMGRFRRFGAGRC